MARSLRIAGVVLMLLVSAFSLFWAAAEAFADPGGWAAVGLTAAWLVPVLVLVALAWRRPDLAQPVILVLVGVIGLVLLSVAVTPGIWGDLDRHVGPARAVALVALAAPTAVLAWHRPLVGGYALLVLGALAAFGGLVLRGHMGGSAALGLLALPTLLSGLLLVLSAMVQGDGAPPVRNETALPTDVRRE